MEPSLFDFALSVAADLDAQYSLIHFFHQCSLIPFFLYCRFGFEPKITMSQRDVPGTRTLDALHI